RRPGVRRRPARGPLPDPGRIVHPLPLRFCCRGGRMTPVTSVVPETVLRCSVLSDPAQLEALRPAWLELLERSAGNEVMLTPMWLLPWWRVFGPLDGRQLRVGLFHQGECLVGLAPLLCRRHWYRPGIPFRRLEPLGCGERPADRVWSDYLNVIARR